MKNWVKSGSPWIWLTAGSVAVSLLALIGILLLLAGQGMRYFWPSPVYQFELNQNGAGPVTVIGELYQQQSISRRQLAEAGVTPPGEAQSVERYLIKVGNREREGQDFRTLLASDIRSQSTPRGLLVLERDSHGTAYGYLAGLLEDGQPLTGRNLGQALQQRLPQIAALAPRTTFNSAIWRASISSLTRCGCGKSACSATISWTPARRTPSRPSGWSYSGNTSCCPNAAGLNRDRQRDALLLRDMHGQTLTIPLSRCAMPGTRTP